MIKISTNKVYGVSNELIESYIERPHVDKFFTEGLQKNKHIIIYGASKQGKTSLTNKHLQESDYIKVNCSPSATLLDIYVSIVRQLNLEMVESREISTDIGGETSSGLKAKIKVPFLGEVEGDVGGKGMLSKETTIRYSTMTFNLALAQDLSELLKSVKFERRIILENFHYLREEIQAMLAIDLRIFEDYNILFIIVGIWREKNKLAQYNGDLVDRVIEVPVEPWERDDLKKIVDIGLPLLNVSFENVVEDMIDSCFDSVGVFQEICKESCLCAGVASTMEDLVYIEKIHIEQAIEKKLVDYSSRHLRCLESFVEQKAKSSEDIPLYIPYYFISILLKEGFENIVAGLKRKVIQEKIKDIHHRANDVRPSDMGYFLTNIVPNQVKKGISPPIFDYDNGTSTVKIIDSTFYFFLKNADRDEVFENLTRPIGV